MNRNRYDHDFHIVIDRFPEGDLICERYLADSTEAKIVADILSGQIFRPDRVFRFNPVEGRSTDVSEDIALAVAARALAEGDTVTREAYAFVEDHAGFEVAHDLRIFGEEDDNAADTAAADRAERAYRESREVA